MKPPTNRNSKEPKKTTIEPIIEEINEETTKIVAEEKSSVTKKFPWKNIQTKQIGKVIRLQKKITAASQKNQPCEALKEKLNSIILSDQKSQRKIKNSLPTISIPPELPIAEKSDTLISLLQNNQVVIVAGETGCGKTTQLPKICLKAGLGIRGKIAHTQPRRVAATSVAARIASEIKSPLGELVGYSVRFSDLSNQNTRIKLMTDGILLAELQSDPLLSQYEVIIIDEAHERSLNIDFSLGFIKKILRKRPELKLIVTSATINPRSFSDYFDHAPIVLIEGRTYPVEVRYQPVETLDEQQNEDNEQPILLAVKRAVDSCMTESTGDILIFSYGENEIKNISRYLIAQNLRQTKILPLYARLSIKEQQSIFSSSNQRKIVVATNVAETSLTIPNIVFVIDIGNARISRYSHRNKIQQLPIEKISQASAQQRKGRCGRICPGICIRLYSEEDFNLRTEYTLPEIKRTNLSSVVLRLKAMKIKKVETFPFIHPPDERQWKAAFNLLFELGAVNEVRELTAIGQRMSLLPLDPQLARILLDPGLQAVEEMLVICSFLSVRDVRLRPHGQQQKADQFHARYQQSNSDVLSIIKLWQCLNKQRNESSLNQFKKWCQKNLINFIGWLEWKNVYRQTKENLQSLAIKINSVLLDENKIHQALICGLVSHALMKTNERHFQGARGTKVWLHPSSQMFKKPDNWLLSCQIVETDKLYARFNAPIKAEWLGECAPHLVKNNFQDIHWRKNKGFVAAYLNQTLLGLPFVNRKIIDYSQYDRIACRKVFLLDGLAADNFSQSFPFLDVNRQHLEQIDQQETKLRISSIRISQQALADRYDSLLPLKICTFFSLKRWLKKEWKKRNDQLSFSVSELSVSAEQSIEDYPSEIMVAGVRLPLSYCFSPGEDEDGVTVEIPTVMLQQFKQSDFEWLVPGYLEEKIISVMKTLPKPIRKSLIPLAETAKQCIKEIIKLDYLTLPFKTTLIQVIKQVAGVVVFQDDIQLAAIPSHLRMKFRTDSKKTTSCSLLLEKLQQNQKQSDYPVQTTDQLANRQGMANSQLYDWPDKLTGLQQISQVNGREIRVFKGLFDAGSHVELREFSNLAETVESHHAGVVRLIILNQLRLIKEIKNSWPDRRQIEKLNIRHGGFDTLLDWLLMAIISNLIKKQSQIIRCKEQLIRLIEEFKETARSEISAHLINVVKLLKQINTIYIRLSQLESDTYIDSVQDIKAQLNELWSPKRLSQCGSELNSIYRHYFLSIESRLDRLFENFPKEKQSLHIWEAWYDWWLEIEAASIDSSLNKQREQLFWALQDYRVSLFSPNIKTRNKISAKKLQKLFEAF